MRIILVRHGRPVGASATAISGHEIAEWVKSYDALGISPDIPASPRLRDLASAATCIVASDLPRARESAASLAGTRDIVVHTDFREAALPRSVAASLRLPPALWIVLARIGWFLNWGDATESVAAARARAARMAERLALLAAEHECVMAVGHGMFNRFIARELRRRGWRGPRALPRGYWGAAEFTRNRSGPEA